VSEEKTKKRVPVKRWIIIALFILGAYCAFMGPTYLRPIRPAVSLTSEPTGLAIAGFQITNTALATMLADVVLILMALSAWRFLGRGNLVPSGFYNAFEAIVEYMWNSVEGQTGKWARRIFPIVATIFLLIFVANLIKLVPGFESIGYLKEAHENPAFAPYRLFSIGGLDVVTVDKGQPVPVEAPSDGEPTSQNEGGATEGGLCRACELVPFLRGSATDLNFTVGLAIVAVFMTQVFGVWAEGPSYFNRFFPIKELLSGGIFGLINFVVGLLELVLEFIKIVSFSFRLFGNIFAGVLLVYIVGATLLPVVIPPGLYLLEIFFGSIQAFVFYLLAMVFISMALVSHQSGSEH
jgi:F-type H+-transporting ATPase subunit a